MCDQPESVVRAMDDYRRLLAEGGITWGEAPLSYVTQARATVFVRTGYWQACISRLAERHPGESERELEDRMTRGEVDLDRAVRDALDGQVKDNLPVLRLTPEGAVLEARTRVLLDDAPVRTALLLDSSRSEPATVLVDGRPYVVEARGAKLVELDGELVADGAPVDLGPLTRRARAATVLLRAGFPCRWSVVGQEEQGWYPDGVPDKRDGNGRPFFHGDNLRVRVPAETITISVTRGMEYTTAEVELTPEEGEERLVELAPERLYDAAARGWYGGDLHVHLNWMGENVAESPLAASAQLGEDLHVLNLVAGNVAGERVYDVEAAREWAGRDLPWSDSRHLARFGVEYRNDLVGHVSGFAPRAVPERMHTGFVDADWPPNAVALAELRELGAITGYGHPFHTPISDTDPPEPAISTHRNCSAREIVADAALGLIDTLDVLNHSSVVATAAVYRHLIGAGNRLAVTAGTDAVLSWSRRGNSSGPPGWARVYARVGGPLTAESFAEAVCLGRTFATTGPWLELTVNGHGPGDTLALAPGERAEVRLTSIGPEVENLEIRTADGIVAQGPPGRLTVTLVAGAPTYVVGVATGGRHPRSHHLTGVHAHTSPVYLDVAGEHVARREDVQWCLDWLDRLEVVIQEYGRFDTKDQLADHLALYDRARAVYRSRLAGSAG